MTDKNNPCKICGSTRDNFDENFCCKECYEAYVSHFGELEND